MQFNEKIYQDPGNSFKENYTENPEFALSKAAYCEIRVFHSILTRPAGRSWTFTNI
jgi:hypothetical protein